MVEEQSYRITRQVPVVRLETFCRSLQKGLTQCYSSAETARIWRLYVSAECPVCGLPVCGEELRALAFAPCAELASAKVGRMRLGNCARHSCEAWDYSLYFWNREEIDWSRLVEAAETPVQNPGRPIYAPGRPWFPGLKSLAAGYGPRAAAMLSAVLVLWFARELYLGGRIPFLREPEKFRMETTPVDDSWPAPVDGAEGPNRQALNRSPRGWNAAIVKVGQALRCPPRRATECAPHPCTDPACFEFALLSSWPGLGQKERVPRPVIPRALPDNSVGYWS